MHTVQWDEERLGSLPRRPTVQQSNFVGPLRERSRETGIVREHRVLSSWFLSNRPR